MRDRYWAVAYQGAVLRLRFDTECEAWLEHDSLVCLGLDPDQLAVVRCELQDTPTP